MSTFSANYAIWTGIVGVVFEYWKRRGYVKVSTMLGKGFLVRGGVNAVSSFLEAQNIPLMGNGLDSNLIYNGVLGSLSEIVVGRGSALTGAEEQLMCSLIGHRLAVIWANAFDTVTSKFPGLNSMFQGSSGYQNATITSQGTPIPSTNSGSNYTNTTAGNFTNTTNSTLGGNSSAL